jgi:hypothetical protein
MAPEDTTLAQNIIWSYLVLRFRYNGSCRPCFRRAADKTIPGAYHGAAGY